MTTKVIDPRDGTVPVEGDWIKLSADLTNAADLLVAEDMWGKGQLKAGRRDVVVRIAPGAGHGSKACFTFNRGVIEIDGNVLERSPAKLRPSRRWDQRDEIAATWGLLCHEAGHAASSLWMEEAVRWLEKLDPFQRARGMRTFEAAKLLEEPRCEMNQVERRNWDRRFLRVSASTHLLGELSKQEMSGRGVAMQAVTLLYGRMLAGILREEEVNDLLSAARAILGEKDYEDTTKLVTRAVLGPFRPPPDAWDYWLDNDKDIQNGMRALADEWLAILARKQEEPLTEQEIQILIAALSPESGDESKPGEGDSEESESESEGEESESEGSGAPQDSKNDPDDESAETESVSSGLSSLSPEAAQALGKLLEAAQALAGEIEENQGFMPFTWAPERGIGFEPRWEKATAAQRRGADALYTELLEYFLPERSVGRSDTELPPGRLNGRQVVRQLAERAAGTPPTATPWRHVTRRMVPTPPLRAGLIVDVSSSMGPLRMASREIAYRFSTALDRLPDTRFRGSLAGLGIAPWQSKPGMSPVYAYEHNHQNVHLAAADLVERLGMLRRGNARLMVIISDGNLNGLETNGIVASLQKMLDTGGHVLWVNIIGASKHTNHVQDPRWPNTSVWTATYTPDEGYTGVPEAVHRLKGPNMHYVEVPPDAESGARAAMDALVDVMRRGAGK